MKFSRFVFCYATLLCGCTCFAQMYTFMDLGNLGNPPGPNYGFSFPMGINNSGQIVGLPYGEMITTHAFRTAPNSPINPTTDDLGTLGGSRSGAWGINRSGQVVGDSSIIGDTPVHAFRTAANSAIDPSTDDLGTLGGSDSWAYGINDSGQVVGQSTIDGNAAAHAYRSAPNLAINPTTDDLGTLGGSVSVAWSINSSGQVVGYSYVSGDTYHAFRTAPNRAINPSTDDLGPFGDWSSSATGINDLGQVIGSTFKNDGTASFAFRTAPNRPINRSTDDLGTLGGFPPTPLGVNAWGEVVGWLIDTNFWPIYRAFLFSSGTLYDLNDLIPPGSGWQLQYASAINDAGEIVGYATPPGYTDGWRGFLLRPIYNAAVQHPINADGSSVFSAKRGVIPVKFAVTRYGTQPSCVLPGTIAVTRTAGGTLGSIDESTYSMTADNGSNFRIEGCRYAYNLAASSLGVGTYRVDISINGIMVGHAVFALK